MYVLRAFSQTMEEDKKGKKKEVDDGRVDALSLLERIKDGTIDDEIADDLYSALSARQSRLCPDVDTAKSGLYGFTLPFYRVTVTTEDGTVDSESWVVVKIGMSIKGVSKRVVGEQRLFHNKRACVVPVLPGFSRRTEKMSQKAIMEENIRATTFVTFLVEGRNVYTDVMFVYPGAVVPEGYMRNRYGLPVGKWKVDPDCRENLLEGVLRTEKSFYDKRKSLKAYAWKIWMSMKPGQPGTSGSFSVGPTEFVLMKKRDVARCNDQFCESMGFPTEYIPYSREYSDVTTCVLQRYPDDEYPLILVRE